MKNFYKDFPFTELRTPTGDYYDAPADMMRAGFVPSQMWSIVESEGADGSEWYVYGPSTHYINIIGYCATAEHHDGETYYHECIKTAEEVAAENAYFCDTCED